VVPNLENGTGVVNVWKKQGKDMRKKTEKADAEVGRRGGLDSREAKSRPLASGGKNLT